MKNKVRTRIKFNGSALENKSINVAHIAPSLLALSDLVRDVNAYANRDRTNVKVFISADIEQNCFELDIEFVQTIWEQTKDFVMDDDVVAIREIAQWIGIIGTVSTFAYLGLYQFIKWIRGKRRNSVNAQVHEGRNVMEVYAEDETEPIVIAVPVYKLYSNPLVRNKAIEVLEPLREDGYDSIEFYEGNDIALSFAAEEIPKSNGSDLPRIITQEFPLTLAPRTIHEVTPQSSSTSSVRTNVRIRKAVYEGRSKWTIVYEEKVVQVSIDDAEWLKRFQSGLEPTPPGSSLDVQLEETHVVNQNDEIISNPSYRIIKIYAIHPPT